MSKQSRSSLGVVAEQPLDDQEPARLEVDGRPERAVGVAVDGLQDRLAAAQQAAGAAPSRRCGCSRVPAASSSIPARCARS